MLQCILAFVKACKPMNRQRRLLIGIVLALVVAGGVTAWALYFRPITVQAAQAESGVSVQVFGLGTVEARVTSKIGFKVSGVLVDLRADVGDHVAKDAILARLDDREQRARTARAGAAVQQAEANLQKANASVQKALANYDIAIALRPDYAWAYSKRANALNGLGRHDEAPDAIRVRRRRVGHDHFERLARIDEAGAKLWIDAARAEMPGGGHQDGADLLRCERGLVGEQQGRNAAHIGGRDRRAGGQPGHAGPRKICADYPRWIV